MSRTYATLLNVRQIEEKQAEIDFAEARRELFACELAAADARRAREAWLDEFQGRQSAAAGNADLASLLIRMEDVERDAERRREAALRREDARREALLEAQRRRQAVENLHVAALEADARAAARRAQAELDDLAGLGAAFRRDAR